MVMVIVELLQWWYGAGWKQQLITIGNRIAGVYDYYSIDLLLRSLFAPFRQISAAKVEGSLEMRWRAFVDRLVSRTIGTIMRSILIVIGIISIFGIVVIGGILLLLWAFVPLAPIIGIVLTLIGWVPWKL